jgi:exodeoxyribonuclease-5
VRRVKFILNRNSPLADASLLIIDECSMVNETLGRDLLSFGVPILVLGDPAQLPPPDGYGFFINDEPDILLTEIHRQARDNPIIWMSIEVREGRPLRYGNYGGSHIVVSWQEMQELTTDIDQFIVGLNTTRMMINRQKCLNWLGGPLPGDKLVCLRNNHRNGLLNGEQYTLDRVDKIQQDGFMALYIKADDRSEPDYVITHRKFFECEDVEKARDMVRRYGIDEFAYGYAMTAHKAQGSQYNNVVVIDERRFFKEYPQCWLYTALTRAAECVTIITQHG